MRGRGSGAALCGLVCLMVLLLTGCGQVKAPEDLAVPAIAVSAKGEVTVWLVEDFDKDYYNLSELSSMVAQEAADFNGSYQTANGDNAMEVVSVTETEDGSRKVVLVLQFGDIAAYSEYMGTDLFYGTVTDAHTAGRDLDITLTSVKDGTMIDRIGIYERGTSHILIAQDKVRIYGPSKPQYLSAGAVMNEDGSVEASNTEEYTYIIMK